MTSELDVHTPPAPPTLPSLSTARIETLADGVFAIVMTLLVFDIRVPLQEQVDALGLPGALMQLVPNVVSYIISFVVLGMLWVGHHNQFYYIRRSNRSLLWINILFLMCVAVLPFSAALLSRYGQDRVAIIVYDCNLIAAELVLYLHWRYGVRSPHLLGHALNPKVDRLVRRRILTPPVFFLFAILVSFVNTDVAILMNILLPLVYIVPVSLDWVLRGHAVHEHP